MATIDTIGRRVMEWCGGSRVLATLLSANVLLSLMLMAACALSGITGVPPGRIVELFHTFFRHQHFHYPSLDFGHIHGSAAIVSSFAFQHAVALLVREVFP